MYRKAEKKDNFFKFKRKLFEPAWLHDFIIMPLLKDTKGGINFDTIRRLKLRKVMQLHSSINRLREWEAMQYWYSDKVSEIKSKLAPNGAKMMNEAEVIRDHIEGKEDDVSAFLLGI